MVESYKIEDVDYPEIIWCNKDMTKEESFFYLNREPDGTFSTTEREQDPKHPLERYCGESLRRCKACLQKAGVLW